jgi:hypothetical protein
MEEKTLYQFSKPAWGMAKPMPEGWVAGQD